MQDRPNNVSRFLGICTELVEGKFLTADAKISEALAALAASKELRELFTAVTQGFDYPAAKASCFIFPSGRGSAHGVAYLPSDRKSVLAFVFCLMVEIDAGTVKLDEFLLRYFFVDGSYTASYLVFADRVLRPFRDIVSDCFPLPAEPRRSSAGRAREEAFEEISRLLPAERQRLFASGLPADDAAAADLLLSGLAAAVGRQNIEDFTALLAGYKYFLLYTGKEGEESLALFSCAGQIC